MSAFMIIGSTKMAGKCDNSVPVMAITVFERRWVRFPRCHSSCAYIMEAVINGIQLAKYHIKTMVHLRDVACNSPFKN